MANLAALGSGLVVSTQQKKIVAVVDDDLGMRVSLAVLFRAIGCVAETFDSAEAFLETFPTSKAGCLVLNIQLGDLSGIELARHLTAEGFKYPVIFTTAHDDEHLRHQAEKIAALKRAREAAGVPVSQSPIGETMAKRELIDTGTDKRYVRRNPGGSVQGIR